MRIYTYMCVQRVSRDPIGDVCTVWSRVDMAIM